MVDVTHQGQVGTKSRTAACVERRGQCMGNAAVALNPDEGAIALVGCRSKLWTLSIFAKKIQEQHRTRHNSS